MQFNGNGTLTTEPKHPLVWNEELSLGNREDDMFMLPNIAMLVSVSAFIGEVFDLVSASWLVYYAILHSRHSLHYHTQLLAMIVHNDADDAKIFLSRRACS